MSYFLDFYFDNANPLISRVKRHFSDVQHFFDRLYIVTLDDRNFTEYLDEDKITHHPLLRFRVPHLVRGFFGIFLGIIELVKIATRGKDLIFFSSPYAFHSLFVSRILKIPSIVHFKYVPPSQPSSNLIQIIKLGVLNTMVNFAVRSADLVVVTTPHVRKMVIDRNVPPEKVVVSPNYVDEKMFSLAVEGKSIRQNLSITKDEKLITYIGRLSREKGLDILIDAFAIVCNVSRTAKLLLIGDGVEIDELKDRCCKLGIQNMVIFLNSIPHNLVPNYLAASDIAVLVSYSEGHPKFLIEAMIMGKAIVGTNIPGISDVARPCIEAEVVEVGDISALAEKLQLVIGNDELALTLGLNARNKALQKYSKAAVFNRAKRNPLLIVGF